MGRHVTQGCLHPWEQKQPTNTHQSVCSSLLFGGRGSFCQGLPPALPGPTSCKLGASSSKMCTELPAKRLRSRDWETATVLRAVIDRTFSQFIAKLFPRRFQDFYRLQISSIVTSGRLYQCNCCLCEEMGSCSFIHCHLPKIPQFDTNVILIDYDKFPIRGFVTLFYQCQKCVKVCIFSQTHK